MKSGKAGKGASHARYIGGVGKYAERDDVVDVIDRNMPGWAKDGAEFFAAADKFERANGRTYTEIEAAIPRAVADPVAYATEYAEKLLGTNHPYRLAIHDKLAADGGQNIHMHLMFSDRKLDGIERDQEQFFKRAAASYRHRVTKEMVPADPAKGGAGKDRKWNERGQVQVVRDSWQEHAKAHGIELDLRSNAAKGMGAPEPKLGPEHPRAPENPAREERRVEMERLREVRVLKAELHEINHQEKQHVRASQDQAHHHQPVTDIAEMRDVWGVDNVHDIGRPQDLLQPHAPGDVRPSQAASDPARLHQLASARAAVEAVVKAQAIAAKTARVAQERAQAIADAERKAAWVERSRRRRSGTPNRVMHLDQSKTQDGRTMHCWGGNGPSAGKVAVIEKDNKLSAAGRYSPSKAAAMAHIAKQNGWQSVTVTGDATFKAMVLPELLARGIIINNLELQLQVQAWQVKAQADADLNLQAKAQAAAERLNTQRTAKAAKRQIQCEPQQEKYPTEHEQRQAERQAAREQWQEKYEAERRLDEAIALIKQQAAAKELAGQPAQNTVAAVAPFAQAKQSAPLARAVEMPAVVPAPARLDAKDVALFQGAEQAIVAGDMKALAGQLRKIDQVERKLIEAVTLAGWDDKPFDEDAASRQLSVRDFSGRREAINAAARERGEQYIPFAVGHSTMISVTYDYQQEQAVRALSLHARSDRPESFFKKQAGRDWDAKKAELETTRAAWERAVASRDRAEQAATTADNFTFQHRLDAIRKEHAAKAAAAIAKCAPLKERLQDFTAERKRIERATATLSQVKQKELGKERGRSHGISR